jgi:GTP:adenosylcobinamide-phosphate guanylyltransferase
MAGEWRAIVLAAGRGPGDPMAKAYGVSHKCALPVAGTPMLRRVIEALRGSASVGRIEISAESAELLKLVMNGSAINLEFAPSESSAPRSALVTISRDMKFPALVTTGDHALLTPEMVDFFCVESARANADFTAAVASSEVILKSYPNAVRTFFRFGPDRVSGCNMFAVANEKGLRVLARWSDLEAFRKKPWRLVAAFGASALLRFALGRLSLAEAFVVASDRLGLKARPVFMPFAEAAIDVDKPADKELAEAILASRERR